MNVHAVEVRQLKKEGLAGAGCHGAVDVEPVKDLVDRANRLHTPRGQAATPHRQQPTPAFILTKPFDGERVVGWNRRSHLVGTRGLERGNGIKIFVCDSDVEPCA